MTNYEKIKGMSIEETAEFLGSIYIQVDFEQTTFSCNFYDNDEEIKIDFRDIKEWLESEEEENERL